MNQTKSDIERYIELKLSKGYEELRSQSDKDYQHAREKLNERGLIGSGADNKLLFDTQVVLYRNSLNLIINTHKETWSHFGISPTDKDQQALISEIKKELAPDLFLAPVRQANWLDERMKELVLQDLKRELVLLSNSIEREVFIAVTDVQKNILQKEPIKPNGIIRRVLSNGYFKGVAITVIGSLIATYLIKALTTDKKLDQRKANAPASETSVVDNEAPSDLPHISPDKQFTTKTPADLMALYKTLNPIAGDNALKAFKGMWIKGEGVIINMVPGASDGDQAGIALRNDFAVMDCRFGPQWKDSLLRLSIGDPLKIQGKIAPSQNASQLYLQECEILQ